MDLWDEFGNYIGPDQEEEEVEQEEIEHEEEEIQHVPNKQDLSSAVVHFEDKIYYQDPKQAYGNDVQVVYHDRDTQSLNEPIIKPLTLKKFQLSSTTPPRSYEFMLQLQQMPERIRNLAVIGNLHSGKTSLLDLLVRYSQPETKVDLYCDCLLLERERKITLKAKGMTFVLPDSKGKSYLLTLIDTPGHSNFSDEVSAACRLADGALVVVDAVEGLSLQTELAIKIALKEQLSLILVISKIDKLILELKLPPMDAYLKLRLVIDEINTFISSLGSAQYFAPECGNVIFASLSYNWAFDLGSFAKVYGGFISQELCKKMWGNYYLDEEGVIQNEGRIPTFVSLILEPLYKIFTVTLSHQGSELASRLKKIGVTLKKSELSLELNALLKLVFSRFFKDSCVESVVDACSNCCLDPLQARQISNSNIPSTSLSMQVAKIYPRQPEKANVDSTVDSFIGYGRIFTGRLTRGSQVRILREEYFSNPSEENTAIVLVEEIFIYQSQYLIPIEEAFAGNIVAIAGNSLQSHLIGATATILDLDLDVAKSASSFQPLHFNTIPTVKISMEPKIPSEMPKMIEALRRVAKTFPLLQISVLETGEYVLTGTGELYLDCVVHDLRRVFSSNVQVNLSELYVKFCETVLETSSQKCSAQSPNHRNTIEIICEPMHPEIPQDLESGYIHRYIQQHGITTLTGNKKLSAMFQSKYSWDLMAARGIWAFGPHSQTGPNVLVDDSIEGETDKSALKSVQESVTLGFQWATREGPLCEEPVRAVKFRLLHATLSTEGTHRGAGQIIPAARRAAYSAMLTAQPRLMEPILLVEIQTPPDCLSAIYSLLAKRRGHVTKDWPRSGSTLSIVHALLPTIDSFGFETDLRIVTHGQAFCQASFSHWEVVPGDPLDTSIQPVSLEPADATALARDFMLKTRKRRGLSLELQIDTFFDQ